MSHFKWKPLLRHLEKPYIGRRYAALSLQSKIERFLIAEIFWKGNELKDRQFFVEEGRRDLTIWDRPENGARGKLLCWLEAKMAYSDCLARKLTKRPGADEYSGKLLADAGKQVQAFPDKSVECVTAIFVVHRSSKCSPCKYQKDFDKRGKNSAAAILREAIRYCSTDIAQKSKRKLVEHFALKLDRDVSLHCFFYVQ